MIINIIALENISKQKTEVKAMVDSKSYIGNCDTRGKRLF